MCRRCASPHYYHPYLWHEVLPRHPVLIFLFSCFFVYSIIPRYASPIHILFYENFHGSLHWSSMTTYTVDVPYGSCDEVQYLPLVTWVELSWNFNVQSSFHSSVMESRWKQQNRHWTYFHRNSIKLSIALPLKLQTSIEVPSFHWTSIKFQWKFPRPWNFHWSSTDLTFFNFSRQIMKNLAMNRTHKNKELYKTTE